MATAIACLREYGVTVEGVTWNWLETASCAIARAVAEPSEGRKRIEMVRGVRNESTMDYSPTLLLPKKRPDLVEDEGGGGFCICEAVGARDWRME